MIQDKVILCYITNVLDILLLYILFIENTGKFDKMFIKITLFCHGMFYYALSVENKILLDILHVFIFALPAVALLVTNRHIKLVVMGLLLMIQLLWILKGGCILHNFPTNFDTFGYGNIIAIFTSLLLIILSYQVYY